MLYQFERRITVKKDIALRSYLLESAPTMTEEWYESLDKKSSEGVYTSNDPDVIQRLKAQNYEFHLYISNVFIEDEKSFFESFNTWLNKVAKDQQHLRTPIQSIIKEFMNVRKQYCEYIRRFAELHDDITQQHIDMWNEKVVRVFDIIILKFITEAQEYASNRLRSQQEMIHELSSPVIVIKKDVALLPLVGDIDTARAKMILESTLKQCAEKQIAHLYIDLSGVVMIDTMVAHELFQLINALDLIGVKSILSGIRPELATTAMQLGLTFDHIRIKSNLAQALEDDSKIVIASSTH